MPFNASRHVTEIDILEAGLLNGGSCLAEPIFIDAQLLPDGSDPNDAKLYFFFRERLTDNNGNTKHIHAMVARVCPVSSIFFHECLCEPRNG